MLSFEEYKDAKTLAAMRLCSEHDVLQLRDFLVLYGNLKSDKMRDLAKTIFEKPKL